MAANSSIQSTDPLVLLIEEDTRIIKIVENQLAQEGVFRNNLTTCRDLDESILFLKNRPDFSAILIPFSNKNIKNISLLHEVVRRYPEKTVLVLGEQDVQYFGLEMIKAGAQDFISMEKLADIHLYETICFAVVRKQLSSSTISDELSRVRQQSQWIYQDVFSNAREAIYICNLEGQMVDFNQSTFELFAFSEEELLEKDIHDLFFPKIAERSFSTHW